MWKANGNTLNCHAKLSLSFNSPVALIFTPIANLLLNVWIVSTTYTGQFTCNIKVHLTPKYFFRSNKSLHLFEMHCTFLPRFNPNLDFLQAVKVKNLANICCTTEQVRGMGLFLGGRHGLICIVLSLCKHACKSVCDVHPGKDPYPLLARSCNRYMGQIS